MWYWEFGGVLFISRGMFGKFLLGVGFWKGVDGNRKVSIGVGRG